MALSSGDRLGRYEILGPLGAGGMGEVYRARDTRLGRDVAIKVLPADLVPDRDRLRRFEHEARAAAALNHPNILALHDIGEHDGAPFLVTELLEGESLGSRIARGPLPAKEAVQVAEQVAHGLAAAHGKGILHRDLKPENLFITGDGHVKILDFGLAKLAGAPFVGEVEREASTLARSTELGAVLGTVGYMAPEQVRGLGVDQRADIFSFGCVLYELLSGQRAFKGPTAADTMSAILSREPAPLAEAGGEIPAALQGIVSQCLEKRPEDRFSSAHDLELALHFSSGIGALAAPKPVARARSRRLLLGGAVLAGVVIVIALAVWGPWRVTPPPSGSGPEQVPSVLALPCRVYGAPEVAFLTDAVPGTISTLLSGVDGIDTKVPPTSFEVDKVKGDLGRLAELYGVSSFVITSISTSEMGFALNVQLVDAATRKVRWGKQYEGPREAYNNLARQAAEGIRLALRPSASAVPTSGTSPEVELALREGDYFRNRYSNLANPADFDTSLAAYQKALRLDPSQCVASARISSLYAVKYGIQGAAGGALKETEAWALRALELDQRCGLAWAQLSRVEMYSTKPDIERQLDCALKAATYAPREASSHNTVSNALQSPGVVALQLAAALRAVELDPFYLPASGNVVWCLSFLGRAQEALPFSDRVMRVEPEFWANGYARAFALVKLGRFDEARSILGRGEAQFLAHPETSRSLFWGQISFALAAAERDSEMLERLGPAVVSPLLDGRIDSITLANGPLLMSPALARLGRRDELLGILLRGVEAGVPPPYDWLLMDPDMQLLRGDPSFAKVFAASRFGAAGIAGILEAARARGELPPYLDEPLEDLIALLRENGTTI